MCYDRTFRNFEVDIDISIQLRSAYISVQCSNSQCLLVSGFPGHDACVNVCCSNLQCVIVQTVATHVVHISACVTIHTLHICVQFSRRWYLSVTDIQSQLLRSLTFVSPSQLLHLPEIWMHHVHK